MTNEHLDQNTPVETWFINSTKATKYEKMIECFAKNQRKRANCMTKNCQEFFNKKFIDTETTGTSNYNSNQSKPEANVLIHDFEQDSLNLP